MAVPRFAPMASCAPVWGWDTALCTDLSVAPYGAPSPQCDVAGRRVNRQLHRRLCLSRVLMACFDRQSTILPDWRKVVALRRTTQCVTPQRGR